MIASAYIEPEVITYEAEKRIEISQGQVSQGQAQLPLPKVMVDIARCESGDKQFNADGSIVKNPTSSAQGRFQIMASLHRETAESMGMDIDTWEGNTQYAMYLYGRNGTRDWNASIHCWGSL